MKKIISVLCTLAMVCGLATTAMAEGNGSITLDAEYYASDWETAQDKVLNAGDIVYLYINANDLPGADKITSECKQFSNVSLKVTYDEEAITPYADGHIETNSFKAKYNKPNQNVPTASTEGIISTGAVDPVSNTGEPGYVANGVTTLILNNGTAGFTLNGNFITLYFEVVDTTKDPNVGIEVTAYDYYDESASVLPETVGMKIAGIGANVVPATAKVVDMDNNFAANKVAYTQGYKVEVVGNGETVTGLDFEFELDGNRSERKTAFTGLNITGTTPSYLGLNVINVPASVEADTMVAYPIIVK